MHTTTQSAVQTVHWVCMSPHLRTQASYFIVCVICLVQHGKRGAQSAFLSLCTSKGPRARLSSAYHRRPFLLTGIATWMMLECHTVECCQVHTELYVFGNRMAGKRGGGGAGVSYGDYAMLMHRHHKW